MPKSFDELNDLLLEMYIVFMKFTKREIGIEEYGAFFRRKDAMVVQFVFLALPLLILTIFQVIPLWATAWMLFQLVYAGFLLSLAKNIAQHMLYGFIWAVTSFAFVVCGMIIYAYFDAPSVDLIEF